MEYVTVHAHTFTITRLATGRLVAHATICVEARYVSIATVGADRLDRVHPSPADWRALEAVGRETLTTVPLDRRHVVARVLTDSRSEFVVQPLVIAPITVTAPGQVATALDAHLRGLAAPAR